MRSGQVGATRELELTRAKAATFFAFVGLGASFASFAARIPEIRHELSLSPAALGLMLLSFSAGAVSTMVFAAPIIDRLGCRTAQMASTLGLASGMVLIGVGASTNVATTVVGLLVFGAADGLWGVAMNVHGSRVERESGSSLMPRFHAGFSVGTLLGAGIGVAMQARGVPIGVHMVALAVVVASAMLVGVVRAYLPDSTGHRDASAPARRGRSAWLEGRTLLIGLFVVSASLAEGAGNDWIAVATVDGHHASPVVGGLTFAAFLAGMTLTRWFGSRFLDRLGPVRAVQVLSCVGVGGVAAFVLGPGPMTSAVGAVAWGAGAALAFPAGMTAANEDPTRAAARTGVVSAIGYSAFLAGPPLLGLVGNHWGVRPALILICIPLTVAALAALSLDPHRWTGD